MLHLLWTGRGQDWYRRHLLQYCVWACKLLYLFCQIHCICPHNICMILLRHIRWKFYCTLCSCTFSSLTYIISLSLCHRKKFLDWTMLICSLFCYIFTSISCFSFYFFPSTVLPSLPLQWCNHFVHMNTGNDNHMTTFPTGMLFVLVTRKFRKLVGSRRVGREGEALIPTINRTFGCRWNHHYYWNFFIFAISIQNKFYWKISRNLECISSCLP